MSDLNKTNRFDLLGNDIPDDEPPSTGKLPGVKQNLGTKGDVAPPARPAGTTGNRRTPGGNEGAFRSGPGRNQRDVEETQPTTRRGGYGARGRGGRGAGNPRTRDDRQSRGLPAPSDKQAAKTAEQEAGEELTDEAVGEKIAEAEKADAQAEDGEQAAEEVDNSVSYADYLAQQAEKKLQLGDSELEIRKANEGSKVDPKWKSAKAIEKEDEEDFMGGGEAEEGQKLSGVKNKRVAKQKATKQLITEYNPYGPPSPRDNDQGFRGGRGRGRGGRGGERGRGERGRGRGGRGRGGAENSTKSPLSPINPTDEAAFPSLGGN